MEEKRESRSEEEGEGSNGEAGPTYYFFPPFSFLPFRLFSLKKPIFE